MNKEARQALACLIKELCHEKGVVLKTTRAYVALKIDEGPNTLAGAVHSNHVSFFIPSIGLRQELTENGFHLTPPKRDNQRDKGWFRIPNLSLHDVKNHKELFQKVVNESASTVMQRRPKKG